METVTHTTFEVRGSKGDGQGRGLYARQLQRPGQLLGLFTAPILALPQGTRSLTVCNHCLSHGVSKRPCTGCNAVVYCSPGCQKLNWAHIHRKECKALRKVREAVKQNWLPTPVRALVQILLLWDADEELRTAITTLESNVDKFRAQKQVWDNIGLQALAGIAYAGRSKTDEQLHLARDILCKTQTNSFDRSDADTGQAGIFLHPILAMANHSCMPNAIVAFDGRSAYLRAESEIHDGEEIRISYIDYTQPLSHRQLALSAYHFQCDCRRCVDDLTVYQALKWSSKIALNLHSLVPELQDQVKKSRAITESTSSTKAQIESIYAACTEIAARGSIDAANRLQRLRKQWHSCQPLVRLKMWAVEPLTTLLEHSIIYFTDIESFGNALSIACFVALNCDPFRYPAPFNARRLKGVLIIAKTITNTAPPEVMIRLTATTDASIMQALQRADQVSICQALALMVLKYGEMAHSRNWEIFAVADSLLDEIDQLPGREKQSRLIKAWHDSNDHAGQEYFRTQILAPLQDLASVAPTLLEKILST